jgi:hypothetical protein
MTIVFSQDPTGPTPYKHEILQIGAVFSTDDLEEVHDRFGCYIRPENYDDVEDTSIYRTGIPNREWMQQGDPPFGTPHKHAWTHFRDLADRHGDGLDEARFLCFDAAYDAPFLRHSVEQVDEDVDMPPITRFIGGLVQATVDVCSYRSYMGRTPDVLEAIRETDNSVNEVREAVFDYYDVSCTRMTDAVQRANAIRHSYRALFKKLNKSSGSKKKKSKSSRRRRSTPITRGR